MSYTQPHAKTVLQLTGMHCNKYGGMEQFLAEIVRACRERGFSSLLQYESMPKSDEYLDVLEGLGARVIVRETAPRRAKNIMATVELLRSTRAHVVNTHFSDSHVIAMAGTFGRLAGARRVVSMVHFDAGHTAPVLARHAYNRCDHVLAVSEAVHHDLVVGGVKQELVKTHYMGLIGERVRSPAERQAVRAELGIPARAVVIGNIAFDAPFKGIDVLLAAMREVAKRRRDVYLLQVGVDPTVSPLQAAAVDLGIGDSLRWAGIRDSGWRMLNGADFYVQSSRFGEGLSLAIMEAMALQLPVIATTVAGNQEAVVDRRTGILVPPGDPAPLARAILDLAGRRSEWQRLGEASHARFRKLFDGHRSVARLADAFYSI
jgi:glycosyltransferase involved in cell wall biosynthesis